MASLFRNIVRINFIKLLKVRNASCFVSIDRCFGKRENVTRVASLYSTESIDRRNRESYRKHQRKFPYMYSVFGLVNLAAANSNDKEGGNSPSSSLVGQSLSPSPSHHVKRSANGRFTKSGTKGTPKQLDHMRRGYQNYIAKRKLEFENCIDENEPPSKRETRSTQVWEL